MAESVVYLVSKFLKTQSVCNKWRR